MDSRQQRPQRKTLQSPQHRPSAGSVQPDTKIRSPQEDLQTQDWEDFSSTTVVPAQSRDRCNGTHEHLMGPSSAQVCEPPQPRHPGSCWNVSIDERRRLAMLHVQNSTNTARASSRDMLDMHLPGPQTVPSPLTKPAPTSSNQVPENMAGLPQDIAQMVADLVYESVDRDVLLPYPLHSTIYANAFQDFLTQSTLWQNENFEAQTSRSPPS